MSRQSANKEIAEIVNKAVNKFPDLRLNQILVGLHIVSNDSNYYEEPEKTLERVRQSNFYKENTCIWSTTKRSMKGVF